jgi:hypothetical protein
MKSGPPEKPPAARFVWRSVSGACTLRREMHEPPKDSKHPKIRTLHAQSRFSYFQLLIEFKPD